MKYNCINCPNKATWEYMPAGNYDRYYCNEHVPRGCSCTSDEQGNYFIDSLGRKEPCCEYGFNEQGFFYIGCEEDLQSIEEEIKEFWINGSSEDVYHFDYLVYLAEEYKDGAREKH